MIKITPELCKKCAFYSPLEKTCQVSIIGFSQGRHINGYAKAARHDPKKCGPEAKLFKPMDISKPEQESDSEQ